VDWFGLVSECMWGTRPGRGWFRRLKVTRRPTNLQCSRTGATNDCLSKVRARAVARHPQRVGEILPSVRLAWRRPSGSARACTGAGAGRVWGYGPGVGVTRRATTVYVAVGGAERGALALEPLEPPWRTYLALARLWRGRGGESSLRSVRSVAQLSPSPQRCRLELSSPDPAPLTSGSA
jgi:hypothetical protein